MMIVFEMKGKKAKATRDKYVGMSHESSSYRHNDRYNDNEESNTKKSKNLSNEDNQWNNKTKEIDTISSIQNHSSKISTQAPIVDLLGDEIDCTNSQDDEFGQFQEATSPVQPSLWPISTQSSSSITFDPFASFQASMNKPLSNEFDIFMSQTQPTTSSINQPFTQQQQRSNTNSFSNTWSSAQGKLDISLNNLIPHTRGNSQKNSLPLNQLTSPTSPTNSGFNTQSIFSNFNNN